MSLHTVAMGASQATVAEDFGGFLIYLEPRAGSATPRWWEAGPACGGRS